MFRIVSFTGAKWNSIDYLYDCGEQVKRDNPSSKGAMSLKINDHARIALFGCKSTQSGLRYNYNVINVSVAKENSVIWQLFGHQSARVTFLQLKPDSPCAEFLTSGDHLSIVKFR